jgi:hypothetical protein
MGSLDARLDDIDFQHATFATLSRLLSCLVTESLVKALLVPAPDHPDVRLHPEAKWYAMCLTSSGATSNVVGASPDLHDVLAVVPLAHAPVRKPNSSMKEWEIGLLDPLDMVGTVVYEPSICRASVRKPLYVEITQRLTLS